MLNTMDVAVYDSLVTILKDYGVAAKSGVSPNAESMKSCTTPLPTMAPELSSDVSSQAVSVDVPETNGAEPVILRRRTNQRVRTNFYSLAERAHIIGELLFAIRMQISMHLDCPLDISYVVSSILCRHWIVNSLVDPDEFVNAPNSAPLQWVQSSSFHAALQEFCDHPDAAALLFEQSMLFYRVACSALSIKNKRRSMEDNVLIWQGLMRATLKQFGLSTSSSEDADDGVSPQLYVSVFAVFDGHHGEFASEYACKHLWLAMLQSLDALSTDEIFSDQLAGDSAEDVVQIAFQSAFSKIDDEICAISGTLQESSGSTACVAILVREIRLPDDLENTVALNSSNVQVMRSRLFVAWVGDSQALVFQKHALLIVLLTSTILQQGDGAVSANAENDAVPLPSQLEQLFFTHAHNLDNETEVERIRDLDESVLPEGVDRICNTLTVTRSLGDRTFKPFVCSEPGFVVIDTNNIENGNHGAPKNNIVEDNGLQIVIATDGLWECVEPEQLMAVKSSKMLTETPDGGINESPNDLENNHFSSTATRNLAVVSKQLCDLAVENGAADNISIVVAKLC